MFTVSVGDLGVEQFSARFTEKYKIRQDQVWISEQGRTFEETYRRDSQKPHRKLTFAHLIFQVFRLIIVVGMDANFEKHHKELLRRVSFDCSITLYVYIFAVRFACHILFFCDLRFQLKVRCCRWL